MTKREALEEAQRRWGPMAMVTSGTTEHCAVGAMTPSAAIVWGEGDSYEAAFADVDRQTQGKEAPC